MTSYSYLGETISCTILNKMNKNMFYILSTVIEIKFWLYVNGKTFSQLILRIQNADDFLGLTNYFSS